MYSTGTSIQSTCGGVMVDTFIQVLWLCPSCNELMAEWNSKPQMDPAKAAERALGIAREAKWPEVKA